ncbi:MAG: GTP 3',8-cyclase MoaA [Sulfuricurvum sp.]|uniref:GTP 3',8-cyclase MoaA n=1 Tax=Sulfuricurvum sp. TaxID=2025608 RepID=UPI0025DC212B|nr:GTP 3',8-cyclase MoaA [Sulfuricurvum sp.]MBV5322174.1 GTP 3',8-cyclase MoaA [Sulfuricurvum sp.]
MLRDRYDRKVTYLRVSVTERCNFRCRYCMAEKPFSWVPKENLLSYEELFSFIKIGIDNGIQKIRLTGGEPTTRENLDELIGMIHTYAPNVDIGLTTNGFLLPAQAEKLKCAGLRRVNISLDSLNRETLDYITQKDVLEQILTGIDAASDAGLSIKLNSVILRGINDHEIVPLFEYAKEIGAQIRYIEYMENSHAHETLQGLRSDEIIEVLGKSYPFIPIDRDESGPANLYETPDGYRFGTIEPHRHDFCATCDRLRLTAEGDLIGCLYFEGAKSIKEAIREGNIAKATQILEDVVFNKPEKNLWGIENIEISSRAFYRTGG